METHSEIETSNLVDANVLELSLRSLVENVPVSTRVFNCITRADRLPFETIGEYLGAGESAMLVMMASLRSFGRRSAEELDQIIHDSVSRGITLTPAIHLKTTASQTPDDELADDQLAAFLSMPVEEAAISLNADPDLLDWILDLQAKKLLPFLSVIDVYSADEELLKELFLFGSKESREFLSIFNLAKPSSDFLESLFEEIRNFRTITEHNSAPVPHPIGLINSLVSTLSPNQQVVLRYRYGFGGETDRTLQEIGDQMGLTRERVRQLQEKALKYLRPYKQIIGRSLGSIKEELWSYIPSNHGAVDRQSFDSKHFFENLLPGEIELAIDLLLDGDKESFFAYIGCVETTGGWHRTKYPISEIEATTEKLNRTLMQLCLPCHVDDLAKQLNLEAGLVALVTVLHPDLSLVEEYIIKGKAKRRVTRMLRLHRLLGTIAKAAPVSMQNLMSAYRQYYLDNHCSERDAQILLSPTVHMFLLIPDAGWVALGKVHRLDAIDQVIAKPTPSSGSLEEEAVSETDTDRDDRAADIIRSILREGPRALGDIAASFEQRSEGRYRRTSVGPVMGYMPEVVRVSPGIYALSELIENFDPQQGTSEVLLAPYHCRLYVMARYAGEKMGSFPFWTTGMERAWCRWADMRERETGSLDSKLLFESLLAVSEPSKWGASDQSYWIDQKRLRGRYAYEYERQEFLSAAPPKLQDLLRALFYLKAYGTINWMMANRISQRRVDSGDSASLLAILIAMGAVKPARHWQLVHHVGDKLEDWLKVLSEAQASQQTVIDWTCDSGKRLLAVLRDSGSPDNGWVPQNELEDLLGCLLNGPENHIVSPDFENEADDTDLLAIFNDSRREKQFSMIFKQLSSQYDELED